MPLVRRSLRFGSFDEIMPDVERLLQGHSMVGNWSLGQVCWHLATVARRLTDTPATTPVDLTQLRPPEAKRQVFATGQLPTSLPTAPGVEPPADLDERTEAAGLRAAIDHFRAATGPFVPHRFFGPLSREEWQQLQLIHMAHHLSFAVPAPAGSPVAVSPGDRER